MCVCARTNSDLCHLQHKLIGFYNRDEKCLLHSTNWVFKYTSLRFVFKAASHLRYFVQAVEISLLRSVPIKRTDNFVFLSKSPGWQVIRDQISDTHVISFFPFSISRITLHFSSTLKTFLLFVTVAMLSLYQSPVY